MNRWTFSWHLSFKTVLDVWNTIRSGDESEDSIV